MKTLVRLAALALLLAAACSRPPGVAPDPATPRPLGDAPVVAAQPGVANEPRVALVIGNGAYASGPLANPPRDARLMAQTLREVGFEVDLKIDAGQADMKRAITAFGERLAKGGVGFFYYAGHGLQVAGQNYLVPVSAKIARESDVDIEAVRLDSVLAEMQEAKNRVNIVALDACRDNPFARSTRSGARGLVLTNAPMGTLVSYATGPGQVADDGDGEHSPYTAALARNMKAPLQVEEMFKAVRREVKAATHDRQTPWELSSLEGSFSFVGTAPKAAAPALAAAAGPSPVIQGPATAPTARPSEGRPEMVRIPGATFTLGSADGDDLEKPPHSVTVATFDLDTTEVTARAYRDCVDARRCAEPFAAASPRCNWGPSARPGHPINCIRWENARDYCAFVGKRLPTEAEWELAARGTDGRTYPWGAAAPGQRACWGSKEGTCEVGSKPEDKSAHGVLDLAGNVSEWTADEACDYDGNRCQGARIYRGGSWYASDARELRAAARRFRGPIPRDDLGVRCARDAR